MSEKKIIMERRDSPWVTDMDGMDFTQALCYIQNLKSEFGSETKLGITTNYDYTEYYLLTPRPETDLEYKKRLKKEANFKAGREKARLARLARLARKKRSEEEEHQLFLKLKVKYEGNHS